MIVDCASSHLEIDVKVTVDSFVAKLATYDADIRLDPASPTVTSATFRCKFTDVKTGEADRDQQMNEWQDTAKFPDVVFALASLNHEPDGRYTAKGRLQLHGVEREETFPVSIAFDQTTVAIDGETKVDTRDFGLKVIRKFGLLKVDPVLTVRFHLQGAIAPH